MNYHYETAAKHGEPMPPGLGWAEQGHFQAIADLTRRFKTGSLTPDQAIKEKREIDDRAQEAISRERYIEHCAALWWKIELAANEYAKAHTIEAADNLYQVLYGLKEYE